jgi:Zn-dependent M28 family amino/carboxypeptidase
MKGRAPSTVGGEKTIKYIVNEYKSIGLKAVNGSYKQQMKMVKIQKNVAKSFVKITNKSKDFTVKGDKNPNPNFTFWSTSQKPIIDIKNTEIVYVGYGVEAPEFGWDDFKGVDVKGKILLMLNNDPQLIKNGKLDPDFFKGESRTYYGRYTYKFEQAMKHGAAGAILIHTTPSAGYGYSVLQDAGVGAHFAIDVPGSGYQVDFLAHMDKDTSNAMAKQFGYTLDKLFEIALDKNFKPISTGLTLNSHIETDISSVETHNLFAMVEGTDPQLKNEFIVFSAHYDHLGEDAHAKENEDSIFNGAWDNGSGSGAILSLAEASVKTPTKRSILFLHCAAEESGTLGSEYFVANPPVKRNQIVADINIDMPNVFGISRDMAVIGVNSNSMGTDLRKLAKSVLVEGKPIVVTDDPNPNAGLFYRSDQVHFAKAGIPALFVESGHNYVGKPHDFYEKKSATVYHKVADQIDADWDLTGLERDMRLMFKLATKLGNDSEQPKWNAGNEFEGKYNQLYKK